MDNIFIFTKTIKENVKCIKRVLQRLANNDLYVKPEKCIFWTKEVEYLRMIISENELQMDPVKFQAIAKWPAPSNVKNVRWFLGFGNYYHQFISTLHPPTYSELSPSTLLAQYKHSPSSSMMKGVIFLPFDVTSFLPELSLLSSYSCYHLSLLSWTIFTNDTFIFWHLCTSIFFSELLPYLLRYCLLFFSHRFSYPI